MRILYIGTPYSIHDVKWATFFSAQKEYEIFFACEKENIPAGKTEKDVKEYYRQLNITYLGSIHSFSVSHLAATFRSIFKLKGLVRENKIDLVHILFAAPFALWGPSLPCKYMITTRGSDILIVIPGLKNQRGIKGQYFNLLFKRFKNSFNNAVALTGTSLRQVERTKELLGLKPEPIVIRTGVDVDSISATSNTDLLDLKLKGQKFIFSPRYMKPVYNIGLQIEAINKLDKNILGNYWFVFVRGDNYDKNYFDGILQQLEALKARGLKYLVVNSMSQQEIAQYYKYASLTIMTPLSDGTPNTALEAMAAKCPLIVPNLPYDEVLFDETCMKLKSYDATELAEKITGAMTNYPSAMIDKAFDAVNKFGNRKTEMEKLQNIYLTVESIKAHHGRKV
ncbi:MAG: glycosyltransferase 1 protein [Bacteroidota bacterium]|nr:glycosyltransferase 1 protein [Bacteroidota bacterium]